MNFQDVLRDVHNPETHTLQTSGSAAATIFAVVNTSAAGQASVVLDNSVNRIGFATVAISTPTIYAVVNTAAAGQASIVIDNSINNIGFATVRVGAGSSYIGLASVNIGGSLPAGVNGIGFATVNVVNQPALVTGAAYVGLASVNIGGTLPALSAGVNGIGFATVAVSNFGLATVMQGAGSNATTSTPWIGAAAFQDVTFTTTTVQAVGTTDCALYRSVSVHITSHGTSSTVTFQGSNDNSNWVAVALAQPSNTLSSPSTTSTTVGIWSGPISYRYFRLNVTGISAGTTAGVIEFSAHPNTLLTTIAGQIALNGTQSMNLLQVASSTAQIGLGIATLGTQRMALSTDSSVLNGGTNKTLIPLPVGLGQNSIATIAVPTNSQKINLTQLILNSNVTTEIAIKSGVTYLTGNASLGVTLFPGGGFVMNGSPDSPVWISLPSGAMVVEKRDAGGTVSKIGGNVIYFDA